MGQTCCSSSQAAALQQGLLGQIIKVLPCLQLLGQGSLGSVSPYAVSRCAWTDLPGPQADLACLLSYPAC